MSVDKKEFALSKLAPYFKNPETCGIDMVNHGGCSYLTPSGNMCVAGACMTEATLKRFEDSGESIVDILGRVEESVVFKPENVGILTPSEWGFMQNIHDLIARGNEKSPVLPKRIAELGLFTYDELVAYAEKL